MPEFSFAVRPTPTCPHAIQVEFESAFPTQSITSATFHAGGPIRFYTFDPQHLQEHHMDPEYLEASQSAILKRVGCLQEVYNIRDMNKASIDELKFDLRRVQQAHLESAAFTTDPMERAKSILHHQKIELEILGKLKKHQSLEELIFQIPKFVQFEALHRLGSEESCHEWQDLAGAN